MVTAGKKAPKRPLLRWLASFVLVLPAMRSTAKKILIVDGDDNFRESLRTFIKGLGHEVIEAATGPDALEKASSTSPDLIIMDAGLPGITGWEVVKRMKADERLRAIRVFMLTGHVLADSRRMAKAVGADGFINKPCLPDELLKVIRAAFADKDAPGPWPTEDGDTPPITGQTVKQPHRPRAKQKH